VPSYGPARAAQFFKKIECFCFTPQKLASGESRRMPVLLVLDPGLEKDVHTVTLSYTFFQMEDQLKTGRARDKGTNG
jgi:cytochrome c oxidase assembly protein subunit 11